MTRPSPPPFGASRLSLLLIAAVTALAAAAPAHAGFGDLVKKAKEKATKTVAPKPAAPEAGEAPELVFDDVMIELTSERIEKILGVFQATARISAPRPGLVAKLNQAQSEKGALWEKQGETIMDTQRKRGDIETCYHDAYQAATDRRGKEYAARALTDPVLREKYTRVAMENNAAAAKGDSAALKRITAVFQSETAPTRDDTLAARKSCGPVPPRLAAETEVDQLDDQIDSLEEQIRDIDEEVAEQQSASSGFTAQQWHMALERLQMYLDWREHQTNAKARHNGMSPAEQEAIEKQREKLRAAIG